MRIVNKEWQEIKLDVVEVFFKLNFESKIHGLGKMG